MSMLAQLAQQAVQQHTAPRQSALALLAKAAALKKIALGFQQAAPAPNWSPNAAYMGGMTPGMAAQSYGGYNPYTMLDQQSYYPPNLLQQQATQDYGRMQEQRQALQSTTDRMLEPYLTRDTDPVTGQPVGQARTVTLDDIAKSRGEVESLMGQLSSYRPEYWQQYMHDIDPTLAAKLKPTWSQALGLDKLVDPSGQGRTGLETAATAPSGGAAFLRGAFTPLDYILGGSEERRNTTLAGGSSEQWQRGQQALQRLKSLRESYAAQQELNQRLDTTTAQMQAQQQAEYLARQKAMDELMGGQQQAAQTAWQRNLENIGQAGAMPAKVTGRATGVPLEPPLAVKPPVLATPKPQLVMPKPLNLPKM